MEGVLLDKCRENMRDNAGKLNVHLYEALKKGLYKPAAFFKGILFPLCEVSDLDVIHGRGRARTEPSAEAGVDRWVWMRSGRY